MPPLEELTDGKRKRLVDGDLPARKMLNRAVEVTAPSLSMTWRIYKSALYPQFGVERDATCEAGVGSLMIA